jgi:maltooligosyltrehalose trehalohydrolase
MADGSPGQRGDPKRVALRKAGGALARRVPVGVEIGGKNTVHARVWAPTAREVDLVVEGRQVVLAPEANGYFSVQTEGRTGDRYGFRVNHSDQLYPDPASRFQPDGPHGLSEIIDPDGFGWTDGGWKGVSLEGQVLYELHTGTFTQQGTWTAAAAELEELAHLGITVVELMPVAEFDGRFGWGYDGVDLFAPSHLYGRPDDLRAFVDRAHAVGIGVILDVVYNHLGPVGNYLRVFSGAYFTDRYENEWGDAINFDGDDSGAVREFFIGNAGYWIDEFHLDGLRLDATQEIFDRSSPNVMAEIADRVREKAGTRRTIIVAENERQDTRLVRPPAHGGFGLDALWNDDFHHSAMVAVTGRAEAYYSDMRGTPQELVSAAKYGYLFQGQHYHWQRQSRGTPGLDLAPGQFVGYLQNHDQVANSARGLRGHQVTSAARWRAITAYLLLVPGTPMLFQGQEFSASTPFLYFADHDAELAAAVRKGRAEFLGQFPSVAAYATKQPLDDPAEARTFARCKLDFAERETNAAAYALHRDLLALRRNNAAFRSQRGVDGAVIARSAFVLRYFADAIDDERLLVVNLGSDFKRSSIAEPLVAPPADRDWVLEWSSEDPRYGGTGTPNLSILGKWSLPGESAIVLAPAAKHPTTPPKVRRRTA